MCCYCRCTILLETLLAKMLSMRATEQIQNWVRWIHWPTPTMNAEYSHHPPCSRAAFGKMSAPEGNEYQDKTFNCDQSFSHCQRNRVALLAAAAVALGSSRVPSTDRNARRSSLHAEWCRPHCGPLKPFVRAAYGACLHGCCYGPMLTLPGAFLPDDCETAVSWLAI